MCGTLASRGLSKIEVYISIHLNGKYIYRCINIMSYVNTHIYTKNNMNNIIDNYLKVVRIVFCYISLALYMILDSTLVRICGSIFTVRGSIAAL